MTSRRPAWQGARQEGFDANHVTTPALRTVAQRLTGELLVAVAVVCRRIGKCDDGDGRAKRLPAVGEFDCAMAIGQEAAMANPLEPAR